MFYENGKNVIGPKSTKTFSLIARASQSPQPSHLVQLKEEMLLEIFHQKNRGAIHMVYLCRWGKYAYFSLFTKTSILPYFDPFVLTENNHQ